MSGMQAETESPLVFTNAAASKVATLIQEEGNPNLNLPAI